MSPFRGRLFAVSLLSALVIGACGQKQPENGSGGGVVVERVEAGYGAARGGLLPEDVLIAWRGEGGSTESEWTRLDSPMDLLLGELTAGQVGEVTLRVERQRQLLLITVPPAPWKARVRPGLSVVDEATFKQGERLLIEGDIEAGLQYWRGLTENAGTPVEVWMLLAAARALIDAERVDEAEAWITAAERRAESVGNPDLQAWTRLQVGRLHHHRMDHESAIAAFTRGLEVPGARPSLVAGVWRSLGDARFRASMHSAAAEAFEHARTIWEQTGVLGSEYLAATLGLGKAERNQSRFDQARGHFEGALEVARSIAPDHPYVGLALQEAGMLSYWQSDLPRAEEEYRAASETLRALGVDDSNLAYLYMGLGLVSMARGELAAAEVSYSAARSIFERNKPGSLLVAWSLRGLAGVALVRSDLSLARRRYEDALEILHAGTVNRADRAFALGELATVSQEQGDLTTARKALTEALQILETGYPQSKFPPRVRTDLAAVLLELGEVEIVEDHLATALGEWERLIPGSLDQAETHFEFGELEYRLGHLSEARMHHQSALEIRRQLAPRSSIEAQSHYALARVAQAEGSSDRALDHLLRALESIEAQLGNLGVSELSRARYRKRHAEVYKAAVDLLLDMGFEQRAFDVLERYRTQLGRELLDRSSLTLRHATRPDLVARRNQLVAEYETAWRRLSTTDASAAGTAEVERLRGRLAELEQERQIVREQLRAVDPAMTVADPIPARWENLGQNRDPGVGILSYSVGREASWLFAAFGGELRVLRLEVGEDELSRLVDRLLMLLMAEGPDGAGRGALMRYGHDLYRRLIAPVEDWLAAAEKLVVLPDGPLHRLPFAALVRDFASGEYVIEWKPVSLRASLAGTARRSRMSGTDRPAGDRARRILAVGDVSRSSAWPRTAAAGETGADSSPPLDWPALPFARAELDALRDLFGAAAEIHTAAAASEAAVKDRAANFRYLHLATHAELDSAMPLDSFLLLSPSATGASDSEDGFLRAWEVIEEIPLNADVVTLSACETGLGEEFAGSGLLGLTRAFHLAGARSVVASLWQVNDRSTSALMVRLYRGLRDGLPAHEALRQAQLELLRGEVTVPGHPSSSLDRMRTRLASLMGKPVRAERKHDYSHPHHWAAFQLYGGAGAWQ